MQGTLEPGSSLIGEIYMIEDSKDVWDEEKMMRGGMGGKSRLTANYFIWFNGIAELFG